MQKSKRKEKLVSLRRKQPPTNLSPFRTKERYYKTRFPPPDYSTLLTVGDTFFPINLYSNTVTCHTFYTLPGLLLLKHAIPLNVQKQLLVQSFLLANTRSNNLSVHYDLPQNGIVDTALHAPDSIVPLRSNCTATHLKPLSALNLLNDLRWSLFGLEYNWTSKCYSDYSTPIPCSISDTIHTLHSALSLVYDFPTFIPQAGVVNYYTQKHSLMSHVDRSESNTTAPLYSVSLGLSCVFVVGECADVEPKCLLLESGDVVVMSGKSRQALHGVPRVIGGSCPVELSEWSEGDWWEIGKWMGERRVNVNVRQAF